MLPIYIFFTSKYMLFTYTSRYVHAIYIHSWVGARALWHYVRATKCPIEAPIVDLRIVVERAVLF